MAEAVVRAKLDGNWREIRPIWSLTGEADDHGPVGASFVCRRYMEKFTELEIDIDGLMLVGGWVEDCESDDGLYIITCAAWQRALDDDPYVATYMVSGFDSCSDSREAPLVNSAYWARAGLLLAERSISMGVQPNTIFYAQQAAGVTYDLGEGGAGARTVWLHQAARQFATKAALVLYTRLHSTRSNHHPAVAGLSASSTSGPANPLTLVGAGGAGWIGPYAFAPNSFRYLSIFMYSPSTTYDLAKTETEYYIRLDEVRISALPLGGGHSYSQDGSAITADMVAPDIIAHAPPLLLGRNDPSPIPIFGLRTEGHQTPRSMLERIDVEQWRYRVSPDRRLDRFPYPAQPILTISDPAESRLRHPDRHNRVVVQYPDQSGDERQYVDSFSAPRQRTAVISLGHPATVEQAQGVAEAALKDQAERRVEGTCHIPPGGLTERPSGQPLHPSRLLLMGGERAWVDEAGDHGRVVQVSYDHQTESADVGLTEPQDDMERETREFEEAWGRW